MSTWSPQPRTRRILRASLWAYIAGVPVLALFFPDLWETYFTFLIIGGLCTWPWWRAQLFRRKTDDTPETSRQSDPDR